MFLVFYSINLYILCTCDLFHILLSLLHTYGSMECIWNVRYVCMCVCIYVCTPADTVTSIKIIFRKVLGGSMNKIRFKSVPKFMR
jgi:hypothetical protein